MKITCGDTGTSTGKPCGTKVAQRDYKCYRHKKKYQKTIPEDISQIVGKKPELIVIDDPYDENNPPPKEIFETVINPSPKELYKKGHVTMRSKMILDEDYRITFWKKIKNKFKRSKNE